MEEKLNEFIINVDTGIISKIVKGNDENIYILHELDFYSIQVLQKNFGSLVRMIENAKTNF